MNYTNELLKKVEEFKKYLIGIATGVPYNVEEYKRWRDDILSEPIIKNEMPDFVRTCGDVKEFWSFIKQISGTYEGRRNFLRDQFKPLILAMEEGKLHPINRSIEDILTKINSQSIMEAWRTAYERKESDPDGAITAARTLMESTCKVILDRLIIQYQDDGDLNKLYKLVADNLDVSPTQTQDQNFKKLFGSCATLVSSIGELRNSLGDAHGKGDNGVTVSVKHAELSINIAGALTTFLYAIFEEKTSIT